jgi:hypothetical protein
MTDFTFALLFFFFAITEKSLSSAILSRFHGSEEVLADCVLCISSLVPPWEQRTTASTLTFECQKGISLGRLT